VLGVTHDPRLLSHADRVIELEDGNVVRDRRASDINTTNNRRDHGHAA
jgi:putative ABC transport system ATP-binding protein